MIETKEDGRQYHIGTNLFSWQNATLQPDHQEASHQSAFRQDHSRLVVVALNEGTNDKLTQSIWDASGGTISCLPIRCSASATDKAFRGTILSPSHAFGKRYLAHIACPKLLQ